MLILSFINSIDKLIDLEQKFLNVVLQTKIKKLNKESKEIKYNFKNIITKIPHNKLSLYQSTLESIVNPEYEKREKIFKDYDISLKEFKDKLFNVYQI